MTTMVFSGLSDDDWKAMRREDVTSTEVAQVFNQSPYGTAFELWHKKRGNLPGDVPENARMTWGKRLQAAIIAGIAEDMSWTVKPLTGAYVRNPEFRIGCTPDATVTDINRGRGMLEIKTVDWIEFKEKWGKADDGSIQAPIHIELQLQTQMLVTGTTWGAIGVLVGGNDLHVLIRVADATTHEEIRIGVALFHSLKEPPPPDWVADHEAIRRLYRDATPGKFMEASGRADIAALCRQYRLAADLCKEAEDRKKAAASELLTLIGDADQVRADGFKVSASTVKESVVPSFTRASYRNLRITELTK